MRNSQREFSIGMLKEERSPGTIAETINMIIDGGLDHQKVCKQLLTVTKGCKTDEEFLIAVKAVLTKERA